MKRAARTNPRERKRAILNAALWVAGDVGHRFITRDAVARAACVSGPLVAKYFSSMVQLRRAVFREAMRLQYMPVLKHCVADESLDAHPELRIAILEYIQSRI